MINYYYSGGNGPERRFGHSNPIANALVVLAGILAIGILLVVGFFAFLVIAAVVAIAALVLAIRLWWLKHSGHKRPAQRQTHRSPTEATVIEGELLEHDPEPRPQVGPRKRR